MLQIMPAQHGCPSPPHGGASEHVPPPHTRPALHMSPAQHGSLSPPHAVIDAQSPSVHTRPSLHLPPVQHGSPTSPHAGVVHIPPTHKSCALHSVPQHGCPLPPHASHDPPTHANPLAHAFAAQHGCPMRPHVVTGSAHLPAVHKSPLQHSRLDEHLLPATLQHFPPEHVSPTQQSPFAAHVALATRQHLPITQSSPNEHLPSVQQSRPLEPHIVPGVAKSRGPEPLMSEGGGPFDVPAHATSPTTKTHIAERIPAFYIGCLTRSRSWSIQLGACVTSFRLVSSSPSSQGSRSSSSSSSRSSRTRWKRA
jgi:hypothetical protein